MPFKAYINNVHKKLIKIIILKNNSLLFLFLVNNKPIGQIKNIKFKPVLNEE